MSFARITEDESQFEVEGDSGLNLTSGSEFVEWDRNLYEQQKQQALQTSDSQYSKPKPDDFDLSLNKEAWEHADLCVKQFIADRNAPTNSNLRCHVDKGDISKIYLYEDGEDEETSDNKATRMNFSGHLKNSIQSSENDNDMCFRTSSMSSPDYEIDEYISDEEGSQVSNTSSEESKTYSQVYNEIYEESVARQEKAEHFCRAFTNNIANVDHSRELEKISKTRTQLWVEQLVPHDMDESSSGTVSQSEKVSEYSHQSDKNSEWVYETIVEEQVVVLNKFENGSIASHKDCFEDLKTEVNKVLEQEETSQNIYINDDISFDILGNADRTFNLQLQKENVEKNSDLKYMSVNHTGNKRSEVLQYEHCEIYHVKQTDKNHSESVVSCLAVTERSCSTKADLSYSLEESGYRPNLDGSFIQIEQCEIQQPSYESKDHSQKSRNICPSASEDHSDAQISKSSSQNSFFEYQDLLPYPHRRRAFDYDANTDVISIESCSEISAFGDKIEKKIYSTSLMNNPADDHKIYTKSEESCGFLNVAVTSKNPTKCVNKESFSGGSYKNEVSEESSRKETYSSQISNNDRVPQQLSDAEISEGGFKHNKYRLNKTIGSSHNISQLSKKSSSSVILFCTEQIEKVESKSRSFHGENQDFRNSKRYSTKSHYSAQKSCNSIASSNNSPQSFDCIENRELYDGDGQNKTTFAKNFARPEGCFESHRSQYKVHKPENSTKLTPKENNIHSNLSEKSSYNLGGSENDAISLNIKQSELKLLETTKDDECIDSNSIRSSHKCNLSSGRARIKEMSTSSKVDGILSKDLEQLENSSIDPLENRINSVSEDILAESQSSRSCESSSPSDGINNYYPARKRESMSSCSYVNTRHQKVPEKSNSSKDEHPNNIEHKEPLIELPSLDNNVLNESSLYLTFKNSASKRWSKESDESSSQCSSENEIDSLEKSGDENKDRRHIPRIIVYNLDTASFNIPSDFKGDPVIFDGEDDLLNITLSDDETQILSKLEAAIFSNKRKKNSMNCTLSENRSSIGSFRNYQPSQIFFRRTEPEVEPDEYLSEEDEPVSYQQHVARLAERILRSCPNYYSQGVKFDPQLEWDLRENVEKSNSSRSNQHFHAIDRRKDEAELVQQFNERLKRQVELIVQRFH